MAGNEETPVPVVGPQPEDATLMDAFNKAAKSVPLIMQQLPEGDVENPALAAIQSLIYEGTPDGTSHRESCRLHRSHRTHFQLVPLQCRWPRPEVATNFKNQGNEAFKAGPGKYRAAVEFYKRGLDANPTDPVLKATLMSNRAQVNLELRMACSHWVPRSKHHL